MRLFLSVLVWQPGCTLGLCKSVAALTINEQPGFSQHDHDEELERYLSSGMCPRTHDAAYWLETGARVREYLSVRAGKGCSESLRQGFVTWLRRSPAERQQYEMGDDRKRAALVDWYLKVVR
jgi:hypothetical protein